jgi:type IX secretion system PorP/SprF family membrane protein
MNSLNKILLGAALLAIVGNANAQQDPMYTHYMYNTLSVNPAYAGTRDALTVTALGRKQWVGFTGAPTSITGTAHMPIGEKVGLGLSFVNDQIGPLKNNQISLDFAYHLKLNSKSKLSFGLKGGVNLWSANLSTLKTGNEIQSDPSQYTYNVNNSLTPNVGGGIYYYRERFYMGISVPKLLQNKVGTTDTKDAAGNVTGNSNLLTEQYHFFTILGTVFNLNDNVKLKPTALLKITQSAPIEGDLTATFILQDKINLGLMYRTGDAVGALVGLSLSPQFYVGYSFDWSFVNNTAKYNNGSHEIMLRYDLIFNNKAKIKSPRYF